MSMDHTLILAMLSALGVLNLAVIFGKDPLRFASLGAILGIFAGVLVVDTHLRLPEPVQSNAPLIDFAGTSDRPIYLGTMWDQAWNCDGIGASARPGIRCL